MAETRETKSQLHCFIKEEKSSSFLEVYMLVVHKEGCHILKQIYLSVKTFKMA